MSISKITVASDFSPYSDAAVGTALAIGQWTGAKVSVVHVAPPPGLVIPTPEPVYIAPQLLASVQADYDEHVDKERARMHAQWPELLEEDIVVRQGAAEDELIRYAVESKSDLLVVGTHGSGVTRFLLGSIAEKIAARSPCPVLVTRADKPAEVSRFDRVVVGVDFSPLTERCVSAAMEIAAKDAHVELVHVGQAVGDGVRELETLAAGVTTSARMTTHLTFGSPAAGILERAEAGNADLIVVGAHSGNNLVERWLGTVSDRVLRHAPAPVLMIPAPRRPEP